MPRPATPARKPETLHDSQTDPGIQAIDDLLNSVGLQHGQRALLGQGIERQPKHPAARPPLAPRLPDSSASKPSQPAVDPVISRDLGRFTWLLHGFSTRPGGATVAYQSGVAGEWKGELNLGFTASDEPANVTRNRAAYLKALGAGRKDKLFTLKQIHSGLTRRVTAGDDPAALLRGDGLMTDLPGALLGIQTADCVPVLVADPRNRAVAAFHAGWRGTLRRIVEGGIGRMRLEFGSDPADLVAVIGPAIGQCCYSVGEEVRHEFESQFAYAEEMFREVYDSDPVREKYPLLFLTARAPGHSNIGPSLHLDLVEANRRQLLDAGVRPESVETAGQCTSCNPERYFSHRGEHGFTGRMLAVIGVKGESIRGK